MPSSRARTTRGLHAVALLTALAGIPCTSHASALHESLALGDRQYAAGRLSDARDAYAEAVQAAPERVYPLRRLAIVESELGETQKGDTQRLTWSEAVKHARDALRLAPDSASTHECLAIALGRQALREGPRARLALSKEIKAEADRAIALDPASARAWHVIAMWNVRISSLNAFERMAANAVLGGVPKGASHENALLAFQKAIELEPLYVHHRLEYARLLKDLKRPADARRELEKALELQPTSSALDARYQAEARTLLEKMPR